MQLGRMLTMDEHIVRSCFLLYITYFYIMKEPRIRKRQPMKRKDISALLRSPRRVTAPSLTRVRSGCLLISGTWMHDSQHFLFVMEIFFYWSFSWFTYCQPSRNIKDIWAISVGIPAKVSACRISIHRGVLCSISSYNLVWRRYDMRTLLLTYQIFLFAIVIIFLFYIGFHANTCWLNIYRTKLRQMPISSRSSLLSMVDRRPLPRQWGPRRRPHLPHVSRKRPSRLLPLLRHLLRHRRHHRRNRRRRRLPLPQASDTCYLMSASIG